MSPEQRIDELESRLAFQDDTLQTLNQIVFNQQQVIDRLELQLQALAKRQAEMLGQLGGADGEDVPPPHY